MFSDGETQVTLDRPRRSELELDLRRAPRASQVLEPLLAVAFCTVGLAIRRLLWLLTSLSFWPLRSLMPIFKCRLRANVSAAAIGAAVVWVAHCPWPYPEVLRSVALLALLSLYGSAATFAVQWPAKLEEVERLNNRWPIRWFRGRLRQPLDAMIVRQSLQIGAATLPGVVGVLVPSLFGPATVALFLIGACATVTTGDNLIHVMVHNRPFASATGATWAEHCVLRLLYWYTVLIVLPACFHNYPFYIYQHNHNHHIENNSPDDTQTTLWYDRTSYLDFARYGLRLAVTIMTAHDVLRYFSVRGKVKLFRRLLAGMIAYYTVLGGIALFNWRAALLCLLGRFCLHGVNQAGLGWYQHALFDPRDPTNDYTNSTNFATPIEPFGAGLHGEHHVRMGRHWSVYQQAYQENPAYKGLISNELDPTFAHDFFALLFAREFAKLGQRYTHARETLSAEQLTDLVRERALSVVPQKRHQLGQAFERSLTLFAVRALVGRWSPR